MLIINSTTQNNSAAFSVELEQCPPRLLQKCWCGSKEKNLTRCKIKLIKNIRNVNVCQSMRNLRDYVALLGPTCPPGDGASINFDLPHWIYLLASVLCWRLLQAYYFMLPFQNQDLNLFYFWGSFQSQRCSKVMILDLHKTADLALFFHPPS